MGRKRPTPAYLVCEYIIVICINVMVNKYNEILPALQLNGAFRNIVRFNENYF